MVQSALTPERLTRLLDELLDPDRLADMASKARQAAHLDATERLAAGCLGLAKQGETA